MTNELIFIKKTKNIRFAFLKKITMAILHVKIILVIFFSISFHSLIEGQFNSSTIKKKCFNN